MGNLHFDDEQFKAASAVSALEYAKSRGYALVPHSIGSYHLRDHDSMVFCSDGRWYWNSQGLSGRALAFMVHYEGITYPEAVLTLCDALPDAVSAPHRTIKYTSLPKSSAPSDLPTFHLPVPAQNMRAALAYLTKSRGLDAEIVQELVRNHQVYESDRQLKNGSIIRNVVFVGFDENMVPRSAFQRGCHTNSNFKCEIPGSCKDYPFMIYGYPSAKTLYMFEAAIDAISHASYYKVQGLNWKDGHRIASGGNAPSTAMLRLLRLHPIIDAVKICTDNDAAGSVLGNKMKDALAAAGFRGTIEDEHCPANYKDWNDYLLSQNGH